MGHIATSIERLDFFFTISSTKIANKNGDRTPPWRSPAISLKNSESYAYLENRHDVIIFCRGWSDLDKISQTGTEWHVDCGDLWKWKPDVECRYGGRLGEFNGMSSQIHVSHCRVLPFSEFTVTIPEPRSTLQGVRIPSAILKIVFHHILFFVLFLMQFSFWRAAAFVSSPIHLLYVCGAYDQGCLTVAQSALYPVVRHRRSSRQTLNDCRPLNPEQSNPLCQRFCWENQRASVRRANVRYRIDKTVDVNFHLCNRPCAGRCHQLPQRSKQCSTLHLCNC